VVGDAGNQKHELKSPVGHTIFTPVLSRLTKLCVLVLLVVSIGGQWALLQSAAWMGMLIDFSRNSTVAEAVCKTFDGEHPCPLCKAIAAGKKSQQKKEFSLKLPKLEFLPPGQNWGLVAPTTFEFFPRVNLCATGVFSEPPTPPPRLLPS